MDKRILLIALLTVSAVVLTVVRENSASPKSTSVTASSSVRQELAPERVAAMADTTLRALGIRKESIRASRSSGIVRVGMPAGFDPLLFVRAMNDSLSGTAAQVVSQENPRERSTTVQVKQGTTVLRSYVFVKETNPVSQKGASPSLPKKRTR